MFSWIFWYRDVMRLCYPLFFWANSRKWRQVLSGIHCKYQADKIITLKLLFISSSNNKIHTGQNKNWIRKTNTWTENTIANAFFFLIFACLLKANGKQEEIKQKGSIIMKFIMKGRPKIFPGEKQILTLFEEGYCLVIYFFSKELGFTCVSSQKTIIMTSSHLKSIIHCQKLHVWVLHGK